MNWQEIILTGLKHRGDPLKIAARAGEAAPPKIRKILLNFPHSMYQMNENDFQSLKKKDSGLILLLLWYHYLILGSETLDHSETEISLAAAAVAATLRQKELEADYSMHAGETFYEQNKVSDAEQAYRRALKIYVLLSRNDPEFVLEVANTLNSLGNVYSDLNNLYKAQKMYEKALKLYRENVEDPDSASNISMVLNNLGNVYSETRQFSQADMFYTEALSVVQDLAHREQHYQADIAEILGNMGALYWNTGQFVKSEDNYTQALTIYRELAEKDHQYMSRVASILNNLGILYSDMGRFPQAEKMLDESLTIRETLAKSCAKYRFEMARTLQNLGTLYSEMGKFHKAEAAFITSLSVFRELAQNDPDAYTIHTATALDNLGLLYMKTKQFTRSEQQYTEALFIRKRLAQIHPAYSYLVARTLNDLGTLYWEKGRFSDAESALKDALSIYERAESENAFDMAETYDNLGLLYYGMKDYSRAEPALQKAFHIRKNLVDTGICAHATYMGKTLNNLGNLYCDMKNLVKAESVYTQALDYYEKLAEDYPLYAPEMAMTLTNLGNMYADRNKISQAEKAYQQAYDLYKPLAKKDPAYTYEMALILNNLGGFYHDITSYDQASQAYTEALDLARELAREEPEVYNLFLAHVLDNMGNLHAAVGDYDNAKKMYAEALAVSKPLTQEYSQSYTPEIAGIYHNLGNVCYQEGNLSDAEDMYNQALKKYRELAGKYPEVYQPDVAGVLQGLGNVYTDTGRRSQATAAFNEALEIVKKRALWFRAAQIYHNYSFLSDSASEDAVKMLELGIIFSREKEYRYAQKGRAEPAYLALLRKTDHPRKIFGILEALRDPDLLSLRWDSQKIRESTPAVAEDWLKRDFPPLRIPFAIPKNVLFLYVEYLEEHILYGAVTDEGFTIYRGTTEFYHLGKQLLANLGYQARVKDEKLEFLMTDFEKCCKKWVQMLPSSIMELLSEKDIVVFSPDEIFSFFPLEGLLIDDAFLCLTKTVLRATSMHSAKAVSAGPVMDSSLVVGNPWPSTTKDPLYYDELHPESLLVYLEDAEREAEILAKTLCNCTVLTGTQATAERFLQEIPNHSIIHFAGHATYGRILFLAGPMIRFPPEFEPEEFAVMRRMRRTQNGNTVYLTDEWDPVTDIDIRNTPVKEGALIFLSACQTGQQRYAGGGHYQGLVQAFLKNGASHVISSLVPVYDESSRDFTLSFFDNLLSGESVTRSLQKSQIEIRKKYKAHISWLPYMHYGPL